MTDGRQSAAACGAYELEYEKARLVVEAQQGDRHLKELDIRKGGGVMDPYLAKLIGRTRSTRSTLPTSTTRLGDEATKLLTWDSTRRAAHNEFDQHRLTRSSISKVVGDVPGTVRYTVGTRTFLLVKDALSDEQRELLAVDLTLAAHATKKQISERYASGDAR